VTVRILIVEDEIKIGDYFKQGLTEAVAIRRVRAKIDDGFDTKLIHTVRGMGYMLDVPGEK